MTIEKVVEDHPPISTWLFFSQLNYYPLCGGHSSSQTLARSSSLGPVLRIPSHVECCFFSTAALGHENEMYSHTTVTMQSNNIEQTQENAKSNQHESEDKETDSNTERPQPTS